jgi:hypothetical protein
VFIDNHYWGEKAQNKIASELKAINLQDVARETSNIENDKFIQWIAEGSFYSETVIRIYDLVKDIRDNYQLQTNGGFSSNTNVISLINEFAAFDSFLNSNNIIYDGFTEFSDLFEVFLEGLIVSHSIPDGQGSKLIFFDDYLLKRLVYYGDPEIIEKYISRYHVETLKCKVTTSEGESFIKICFNFLDGDIATEYQFNVSCEKENMYFWEKYNRIFSNILVLFRLLDLDKHSKIAFAIKLLKFLENETKISERKIKYFRKFLWKIKDELPNETKAAFSKLILINAKYHCDESFELISALLVSDSNDGIPTSHFSLLKNLFFNDLLEHREKYRSSSIVYFYKVGNEAQRLTIKSEIEKKLAIKFDFGLYYISVIYDVIEYNNCFDEFVKKSIPKDDSVSFRSMFSGRESKRFDNLNMLINLCFKLQIDLKLTVFDKIRLVDPYYHWLLDIDGFDYSNFKPSWILEYQTMHYSNRFRSSRRLRDALTDFLKIDKNPTILKVYFNIFSKNETISI